MQRLTAGELHQDACEMRALLFAAGERRQLPIAEMRQSDLVERGIDQPLRAGAAGIASTVNGKVTLTCCDSIARWCASSRGG